MLRFSQWMQRYSTGLQAVLLVFMASSVLVRLFQCFDFELLNEGEVRPYMGTTLEPRPGVLMRVRRRAICKFV